MMNIWSSIFTRILMHFYMQDQHFEDVIKVWEQHRPLLDIMRTGDVGLACAEPSRHIYDTNLQSLGLAVPGSGAERKDGRSVLPAGSAVGLPISRKPSR